jgi:hypothetical protein
MPRRKRSPVDEALEKLAAQHGNILDMLDDVMEAVWSSQAGRAFERGAPNPRSEPEEFERFTAALIQERIDARIGKNQRAAGRKGKGVRREEYRGKPIPSRKEVRDAVLAMHEKLHPTWSFNRGK